MPTGFYSSLAWNGDVLCTIDSTNNSSATSIDGLNWNSFSNMPSGIWTGLAWNGVTFCSLQGDGNAADNGTVALSINGETWSTARLPSNAINDVWQGIIFNGKIFCSVSNRQTTLGMIKTITSVDGENWLVSEIGLSVHNWARIGWSGTLFYTMASVFSNFDPHIIIATSKDGLKWEEKSIPMLPNFFGFKGLAVTSKPELVKLL